MGARQVEQEPSAGAFSRVQRAGAQFGRVVRAFIGVAVTLVVVGAPAEGVEVERVDIEPAGQAIDRVYPDADRDEVAILRPV